MRSEELDPACCVACTTEVLVASDGVMFERYARWVLRMPIIMESGRSWHVGVPMNGGDVTGDGVKVLQRTKLWMEHECSR